ncbi:cysteine--1-D-myo-inosityl 2-amino-2-deoxy-alpha-D-glucopyranoside ligase [Auraticoccus sp. F435]|uniref:L-cysteine:1D-myo-inositol 2-amino-2-deoxy-alpha-D-glucopyranoside ligase n=1 Tax=Auraticoccus cholistanensis TaxID=2656650 RepID=A0A6A9UYV1_9ACTN|nr:cysteine--1-D-myo-inosityl 2-amino-2-deoxy-alpha-D-glucopyranoside ligase [Auraticoccus cholistanensis]MVA77054.1 cysteine--1-D-myo-inosityl 2-amino-2-deoxy-alpha-D-glucopyranoside ligase [Auraticoccus cholistanensis]
MHAWSAPSVPVLPPLPEVPVLLHDTTTGARAEVGPAPADGAAARFYVCGITPYDATHMGHANTYVAFDLLHRAWRDRGLDVHYVQNVTDVDDPLLERATATGVDWTELASQQTQLFRDDMEALNVIPPRHYVGAVESIELVHRLLATMPSALYQVDDPEHPDWYFSVRDAQGFGSVSGLDPEQMASVFAERGGDPDRPGKRDPLDCLVWRLARPGEPSWPSPLGEGRPGWHIECTAIALAHLGPSFDVQGGGSDLVFPHHEMCAAEGEVACGQPFAQHYVHSGMVGLEGRKMSKSEGNLVLVSRLREQGVEPAAIRLALLSQHYRSDWSWTPELLAAAEERLAAWRSAVARPSALGAEETVAELRRAVRDDLDAPAALAAVDAWAAASATVDGDDAEAGALVTRAVDAVLGVRL